MKIEIGKTYETRHGHVVRILCTDRKSNIPFPVVGLRTLEEGGEILEEYTSEGRFYEQTSTIHAIDAEYDLIREHTPITYLWANLYKPGDMPSIGKVWNQYKDAFSQTRGGRVGIIQLAFDSRGFLIVNECEVSPIGELP